MSSIEVVGRVVRAKHAKQREPVANGGYQGIETSTVEFRKYLTPSTPYLDLRRTFQNCLKPLEVNLIESTVFHPLSRHIVIPATLGGMLFKKTKKKKDCREDSKEDSKLSMIPRLL